MASETVHEIYERHVKPLPKSKRMELMALASQDMAGDSESTLPRPMRSIMDLHGLGKEIWQDVDAQKYVDGLRDEWDDNP